MFRGNWWDTVIELGGNIVLDGFDGKDFTELIVVKKIVGQYARQITDSLGQADLIKVALTETEGKQEITTILKLPSGEHTAVASATNLYMALDQSLRGTMDQTK